MFSLVFDLEFRSNFLFIAYLDFFFFSISDCHLIYYYFDDLYTQNLGYEKVNLKNPSFVYFGSRYESKAGVVHISKLCKKKKTCIILQKRVTFSHSTWLD